MTNKFIKKQLDFIVDSANMTDIYEIDKVRYFLEVFYGEFFKLIAMVIISIFLNKFPAFVLIFTLLILIRPFIGGSHSKTFIGCMIKSNLTFIFVYYLAYILPSINIFLQLIFILLSIYLIQKYNPVNPLRKNINTHYKNFSFKNIVSLILIVWLLFSNILLTNYYINCGLLIILYLILDFMKEVKKHEKKIII